jgi:hypothetical protein
MDPIDNSARLLCRACEAQPASDGMDGYCVDCAVRQAMQAGSGSEIELGSVLGLDETNTRVPGVSLRIRHGDADTGHIVLTLERARNLAMTLLQCASQSATDHFFLTWATEQGNPEAMSIRFLAAMRKDRGILS